jgi:hypothetical protein
MADTDNRKVIIRKQDRIDYVLDGLCGYWGISRNYLYIRASNNPTRADRKKMAIFILYEIADCSLKDICYALHYKPGTEHALHALREAFRERINHDYFGDDDLKLEYKNVLNHLQL